MDNASLYLTGKAARHLRGLGHHLSPTAMIGKEGITDGVVKSVEAVLVAHELIKVKIQENCPLGKEEAAELLARKTKGKIAQIIGRTFLLYRENQDKNEEQKIHLPRK
jgi:RNA-binding protein